MESQLSFETINQALAPYDLPIGPAYLHGLWCGLIVGEQYCKPQDWVDLAWDTPDAWLKIAPNVQALLLQLAEQSIVAFSSFDFGFRLLLPDDETTLQLRADALNEWCEGFVFGLQNQRYQKSLLSGDGAQALADITKICEMDFGIIECEEEEQSYMEIVEYVRMAVLTIHQNFLENTRSSGGSTAIH